MSLDAIELAQRVLSAAPVLEPPLPDSISIASTAGEVVKRLQTVFDRFMSTLSDDEEIGMALASFGAERMIHVESVAAIGPNLILVSGSEDGFPVELVQHVSQLSFLLIRLKPISPDGIPRRTIGFVSDPRHDDMTSG